MLIRSPVPGDARQPGSYTSQPTMISRGSTSGWATCSPALTSLERRRIACSLSSIQIMVGSDDLSGSTSVRRQICAQAQDLLGTADSRSRNAEQPGEAFACGQVAR